MKRYRCVRIILIVLLWAGWASAATPLLAHRLSGGRFQYVVRKGDTLPSLASRFGVETAVLAADNGRTNINSHLTPGSPLWIDNRHIVPADIKDGILINIPQRMLFVLAGGDPISAYPVAVGKPSWRTSRGPFTVIEMRKNPVWRVPKSIQAEMAAQGKRVRTVVPPGPKNPLGKYFIALSLPGLGIHSTNLPGSIYHFRTHGCIRLHPDDAAALFSRVHLGTPGSIVYEPILLAQLSDGRIFLEANPDAYHLETNPREQVQALADSGDLGKMIDWRRVKEILETREALAREVTLGRKSRWHDSPLAVVELRRRPGGEETSVAGSCSE